MESEEHITYRLIDGKIYKCKDIGCDDFARAARSRVLMASGVHNVYYDYIKRYLSHTPARNPLPSWMPLGELPQV